MLPRWPCLGLTQQGSCIQTLPRLYIAQLGVSHAFCPSHLISRRCCLYWIPPFPKKAGATVLCLEAAFPARAPPPSPREKPSLQFQSHRECCCSPEMRNMTPPSKAMRIFLTSSSSMHFMHFIPITATKLAIRPKRMLATIRARVACRLPEKQQRPHVVLSSQRSPAIAPAQISASYRVSFIQGSP